MTLMTSSLGQILISFAPSLIGLLLVGGWGCVPSIPRSELSLGWFSAFFSVVYRTSSKAGVATTIADDRRLSMKASSPGVTGHGICASPPVAARGGLLRFDVSESAP